MGDVISRPSSTTDENLPESKETARDMEEAFRAASASPYKCSNKKVRRPRKGGSRRSSKPTRVEGARCIACSRVVSPPTIEGFEEHSLLCPEGFECWGHAASINAANPEALLDASIQLYGGMTAVVVGVRRPRLRKWMPIAHLLRFESGREEEVVLADGKSGQHFRLLLEDECHKLLLARQTRLEAELEAAKQHAADLAKADRAKAEAIDKQTRQFEDHTLCTVCLDREKTTALVPCGTLQPPTCFYDLRLILFCSPLRPPHVRRMRHQMSSLSSLPSLRPPYPPRLLNLLTLRGTPPLSSRQAYCNPPSNSWGVRSREGCYRPSAVASGKTMGLTTWEWCYDRYLVVRSQSRTPSSHGADEKRAIQHSPSVLVNCDDDIGHFGMCPCNGQLLTPVSLELWPAERTSRRQWFSS